MAKNSGILRTCSIASVAAGGGCIFWPTANICVNCAPTGSTSATLAGLSLSRIWNAQCGRATGSGIHRPARVHPHRRAGRHATLGARFDTPLEGPLGRWLSGLTLAALLPLGVGRRRGCSHQFTVGRHSDVSMASATSQSIDTPYARAKATQTTTQEGKSMDGNAISGATSSFCVGVVRSQGALFSG